MKTPRSNIVNLLKRVWPSLADCMPGKSNIAIPDGTYWLLARTDIESIVRDTWLEKYKYVAEGFDCDDYALIFHAFTVQERYKRMRAAGETGWLPFAIGEVWGTRLNKNNGGHAVNIAITQAGEVLLIEPQNDNIWSADPDNDHVHYIRM